MARRKLFTDIELAALLTVSSGNYHRCAAKLKVSRTAINHRVAASPELTSLVSDLREGRLDLAESARCRRGEGAGVGDLLSAQNTWETTWLQRTSGIGSQKHHHSAD